MRKKIAIIIFITTFCTLLSCSKDRGDEAVINGTPQIDSAAEKNKNTPDKAEEIAPEVSRKNNLAALRKLMPAYQTFTIDTAKKNTLHSRRGTHLKVPAESFVGPGGKPATGIVKVSLVEAMNSADIMAANIPMTYNDGKQTYQFESAGMFRVSAWSGNKRLKLGAGKKITVHFPDIRTGNRFYVYRINSRGQWTLHGHNQEVTQKDTKFRKYKIGFLTWWNFDYPQKEVSCLTGSVSGIPENTMKNLMIRLIGIDKLQVDRGIILGRSFSVNALKQSYVKIIIFNNGKLALTSGIIQVGSLTGSKTTMDGKCRNIGDIQLSQNPVEIKSSALFKKEVGVTEPLYKKYIKAFKAQQDDARSRRRGLVPNIPTL